MEQYDKRGLKVLIFPGFFIRQEIMLRQRLVLENRLLDPVDKVHEADTLVSTVGLPYAEGGESTSAAWSVSWDNWRGAMSDFDGDAAQRSWYKTETLLEIQEMIPSTQLLENDDGTSKVSQVMIPIFRQVRPETFDAIRIVDAHILESKTAPEGWVAAKILDKMEVVPDPSLEELKRMTGYDSVAAEECIRLRSIEMIEWAFIVLNRSFKAKHTPSQTGDIFMMNQTQGEQRREYNIDPTSAIGKPSGKGRTGVHQA